jgi:hypothetical protein
VIRDVVAELWSGAVRVHRLDFMASDVPAMSDAEVARQLRRLGVTPLPTEVADQRTRLEGWPTQADLDAIATAYLAWSDGVRPTVRVIEVATFGGRPSAAGGAPAGGSFVVFG